MTSDRILSQHGNVIAANFAPDAKATMTVTLTNETLYCDGHVTLIRTIGHMGGKPAFTFHTLGDLATGNATFL